MTMAKLLDENDQPFLGVNLYTQFEPGARFEYMALQRAMHSLDILAKTLPYTSSVVSPVTIGFPMIGCGIGGGGEDMVKALIHKKFDKNMYVLVQIVEHQPPAMEVAPSEPSLFGANDSTEENDQAVHELIEEISS